MGFLNSLLLLFGLFAAVPILIHLLNRQRVKLVYFSSLKYLKNLQKTRMRKLRIRQLLLLLLRMLIILVIVAAFARPTIQGGFSAGLGAAAKTSAVILLDNSLSMSAETRDGSLFESGRDFAAELLGAFSEGDEVMVATFNTDLSPVTDGFALDYTVTERLIRQAALSNRATDAYSALADVFELMDDSRNLNREIYVISDFAETGWSNFAGTAFQTTPDGTRIYLVPIVDPEPDNIKVTSIDFGRQLIYPNRPVEIQVGLANDIQKRAAGILASLYVDGSRVSQSDCDIPALSENEIVFVHSFTEAGLHSGYIELPDDAIIADNKLYFTLSIPKQLKVLVIGENESDNLYFKLAVKPQSDTPTQIILNSIGLSSLSGEDLFSYDCIVLNGINYLSEAGFSAIDNFAASGGRLLIFLPPGGDMKFYGSRIAKKYFGADLIGPELIENQTSYFSLERLSLSHPIFSRYSEIEKENLPKIKFREIVKMKPSSSTKVLGWYSTGTPAIVESDWGQGLAVLFASDLRLKSSEFVQHPLFVTFVNRAIEYLVADMTRVVERYHSGDIVERNLSDLAHDQQLELIAPDGGRSYVTPNFSGKSAYLSIKDADSPGIYTIAAGDNIADQFAVNVPAVETIQRYVDPGRVSGELDFLDPEILETGDDGFLEVIRQNRFGQEIWRPFLLIALALLAVEMVIARSGNRPTDTQN